MLLLLFFFIVQILLHAVLFLSFVRLFWIGQTKYKPSFLIVNGFFKNFSKFSQSRAAQVEIIDGEKGCSTSFTVEKIEFTRVKPRVFSSETRFYTASTISTVAYTIPLYIKMHDNTNISKN